MKLKDRILNANILEQASSVYKKEVESLAKSEAPEVFKYFKNLILDKTSKPTLQNIFSYNFSYNGELAPLALKTPKGPLYESRQIQYIYPPLVELKERYNKFFNIDLTVEIDKCFSHYMKVELSNLFWDEDCIFTANQFIDTHTIMDVSISPAFNKTD